MIDMKALGSEVTFYDSFKTLLIIVLCHMVSTGFEEVEVGGPPGSGHKSAGCLDNVPSPNLLKNIYEHKMFLPSCTVA